ncbi:MAG: hypothetical protein RQ833_05455 [Sphingomonadaceae bacterium]|nr:hypothetical protein [Sphingomonadaceae bacterium]
MRRIIAAAVAAVFVTPIVAHAAPVTGGTTVVRVLAPLGTIVPGVLGTATLRSADPLDILFPITGGNLTITSGVPGATGTIEHDGSGFSLTQAGTTAEIRNLVIDFGAGTVLGDVSVGGASQGTGLTLFNVLPGVTFGGAQDLGNPQAQLNLSQLSVDLLTRLFGVTGIDTSQRFGTFATVPQIAATPTPAPAAIALFGLAPLALAVARRRA